MVMNNSPSFQRVLYLDDIKEASKEDLIRTKAILFLLPGISATKARLKIFSSMPSRTTPSTVKAPYANYVRVLPTLHGKSSRSLFLKMFTGISLRNTSL